jgi:hypothetical protein
MGGGADMCSPVPPAPGIGNVGVGDTDLHMGGDTDLHNFFAPDRSRARS